MNEDEHHHLCDIIDDWTCGVDVSEQEIEDLKITIADFILTLDNKRLKNLVKPVTEPRYDDVYYEGVKALDEL